MLTLPRDAPGWAHRLASDIDREFSRTAVRRAPVPLQSFSKTDLPGAAVHPGSWIYVPDATGGAVPAYSDGSAWRRPDTTVIS